MKRELNSTQVRQTNDPGRYRCGDCLWLQVTPTKDGTGVTKSWLLRYVISGRERVMGLGSLQRFTLLEARARARGFLQQLADGIDPLEFRQAQRDARRADVAGRIIFKDAAKRFLSLHEAGWKNAKHRQQWHSSLARYAYPTLGSRPVAAIDATLVNETVAPIWATTPETASRVKQRIERVLEWVKEGMPLTTTSTAKRVQHHAAMTAAELPGFMARLRERESISARALEFTILTASRTGETIGARWDEIEGDVWTVPASRMKGHRQHRVPLSARAMAILAELPRDDSGFVFPGPTEGKPLSNMAMLQLLKGMDGNGYTVHGFRSTFTDWARERTAYPRDVTEMALAHAIKDKTEAAYRRGDLLPKRKLLMADWERFCMSPAVEGKVLTMKKERA